MSRTAVSPSVRSVNAAPPVVNPHPVVNPIRVCLRHLCSCVQDTSVPLICSAASPPLLRQRVCVRMPSICTIVTTKVPDVHHCYYTFERSGDTVGTRCVHRRNTVLLRVSIRYTPCSPRSLFLLQACKPRVHTSDSPGTDPYLDRLNVSLQALTCVNKAPTSVPGKRQSLLHFGFPVSGFRFRVWGQGFVFQLQVTTNV